MSDIITDNRFEVIGKAKEHLLEATNIETSPDEMAVLDSFLFRCWQMGWLKQYDVAPVKHGRWIEYGENKDGTHNICCSVCDGFFRSKGHANSCYTRNKYRYCHNCGARMDEEVGK